MRALLRKMQIHPIELEAHFDQTRFCGVNLLSPCTESNAKLAHRRYVEEGAHMFRPCTPKEQIMIFQKHCETIRTEQVACYCTFCTNAINMGGKHGVHLLELLFPEDRS